MKIDNEKERLYTRSELESLASIAAEKAVEHMLNSLPILDKLTTKDVCSSDEEGASDMPSIYRETYSYIDESGNLATVRINGKNKRDTDAKFQAFLTKTSFEHKNVTLREYIDSTYRKSFIDGLAATTKSNYERYLKLYILPFMGDMPIGKITLTTVQSFYDWLASAHKHGAKQDLTNKSIERIGGFLGRMFGIAEEMHVIRESPVKIKLLRNSGKPSSHHKALPDEEVDRVKRSIADLTDERERLYMGFLVYTGLRREEILGLKWGDIDESNSCGFIKTVVVYPGSGKPVVKEVPKTKYSERPFIIPKALMDIVACATNKKGFIIHSKDMMKPISLSTFKRMYRSVFKQLGIEGYNNHDWRTTYGTQLKESGMTSAQVADIMGHADTRMVETVYARTRYEGVMKHKYALEELNKKYASGT